MLTTILGVLGTNLLTQFYKKMIAKYSENQIHAAVFIIALVYTIVTALVTDNPSLKSIAEHCIATGLSALGTYELIFKKIGAVISPIDSGSFRG